MIPALPERDAKGPSPWSDALLAASLFAVDPVGCGGIALRSHSGALRETWLNRLRSILGAGIRLRPVPLHVTDERLLGGLDLVATLQSGRPVAERGLLAEADGGVLLLAMAERLTPASIAHVTMAMDAGQVRLERDGLARRAPARFGVVALDEGIDDERVSDALLDRLAFHLDLNQIDPREKADAQPDGRAIPQARARLPLVEAGDDIVQALCATAMALAVPSVRAALLAVRVARAMAALDGRHKALEEDAAVAARLLLAPRARALPQAEEPEPSTDNERDSPRQDEPEGEREDAESADRPLDDVVLDAAQAAIPAGLLARLRLGLGKPLRTSTSGRAGVARRSRKRGRPIGVRRGDLKAGARLNLVETLRTAAPWQPVRRRERQRAGSSRGTSGRVDVRQEDFRITRFKQPTETTTIFVVDASGSAALNRLAEVKGAIELLLADCYVRRDQVALVAFRKSGAEVLLPPTRSLVRAKRSLAGLPGGGGTPLAAGLDAAVALADSVRRKGQTPVVVILTDGRANVGRDGEAGREKAYQDALDAARSLRSLGFTALLVDSSPKPQALAQRLAVEMGATYLPLPYANAALLSKAASTAATSPRPGT